MEKIHKTQIISLNNKVMLIIIYTIIIIKKIIVTVYMHLALTEMVKNVYLYIMFLF